MTCREAGPLLHARLDNELDMAGSASIDLHLAECRACAAQYAALESLHEEIVAADLGYAPGPALERKIAAQLPDERKSPFRFWSWNWLNASVTAAAIAVAVLVVAIPILRNGSGADAAGAEILDSHLRSLQPMHQVDVISTDQHTVKPWFQGKTQFFAAGAGSYQGRLYPHRRASRGHSSTAGGRDRLPAETAYRQPVRVAVDGSRFETGIARFRRVSPAPLDAK